MAGIMMHAHFVPGISTASDTYDGASVIMPNTQEHFPTRIVLLGKTGVGKSAAGNTILGQKLFKSALKSKSVTCECSEKHATFEGRFVSVVDTPGFFDTETPPYELITEIGKCIYLSSPGPHAFLILFKIDDRFTEQEEQIPQQIEMLFGQGLLKHSIVLFTRGDQLDGESVEELIQENDRLRRLINQCGGRYHILNNKAENNREQVHDLLQKIDAMIEQNQGAHYSNQMFEDAQRFKQEEEERKKAQEEESQRQEEEERQRQEEEERTQRQASLERRQREKEWKKQQKEISRQKEIERVIKETENRVRTECESQPELNSGFQRFFPKYEHHIYLAAIGAGLLVGGAVGGAVVYGTLGGAVGGGVVGGVFGGAKSRTLTGAVCGTVGGAAVGAAIGGTVVAAAASSVGVAVAKAVGVGVVSGAAVGGVSTGTVKGAIEGAVVGGAAVGGAAVCAALSGTVGAAAVCGAVAGGDVGGAAVGGAASGTVKGAIIGGALVGGAAVTGAAVGHAAALAVKGAITCDTSLNRNFALVHLHFESERDSDGESQHPSI